MNDDNKAKRIELTKLKKTISLFNYFRMTNVHMEQGASSRNNNNINFKFQLYVGSDVPSSYSSTLSVQIDNAFLRVNF